MKKLNLNNFIPYGRHFISDDDINSILKVLDGKLITQGEFVPKFENKVAEKVNAKHGIAVNSATSALHLACLALDVGVGDIVWTSPISFVASANCALYCGAKVDFVDIDTATGLIDIKKLEIKLANAEKNNALPKVLIPVHLAGSSCDMNKINSLSKKYSFLIIEDASHAIGGKYENQSVGNCKYSSITVFSFHPVKIITTGEGGLLTTNKNDLAEKIRMLRSHGIVRDKNKFQYSTQGSWKYEQQLLGFNYRMTDLQAALGLSQLNRLDEIVTERNRQLKFYYEILKDLPLTHLIIPENVVSSVHLAVIKLKKVSPQYYLDVFEGMRSEGIGVQLHYIPIYKQPYFSKFNFEEKNFPGSEEYSSTAISIPIFPGLKEKEQLRVRDSLKKFL